MILGSNAIELNSNILPLLDKAVKYVIEKMHETLKQHILDDVYYYDYYPNKSYAYGDGYATMDFLEAFQPTGNVHIANGVSNSILYLYQTMRTDSIRGIHVNGTYDLRPDLAELLNVKGIFAEKERNLYWDNFIDAVDSHLLEWFEEGFNG